MSFIEELKQRNVFRVGIAYLVVAWLVLQLADIVLDNIDAPTWVFQTILLLLVIGFPVALVFAWAFELTPDGLKKEKDVDRSASVTPVTGRKLDFFIIGALALALVFVVIKYVLPPEVSENQRTIAVLPFDNRSAEEENAAFFADGVHDELLTRLSEIRDPRSIAVLPFDNRSADEENAAFFADGVHDELLTRLSKIHDLRVISRTSVMQYRDNTTRNMRQIGAELGVGSILEGGVQRAGNAVRINVQLINAQTDIHLWANTYDAELTATNIFEIQTEISTAIANALRATLSPDEQKRIAAVPTENTEALEAYFIGRYQYLDLDRSADSLAKAIAQFEHAIALDPNFALAYSGLAEASMQFPFFAETADPVLVSMEVADAAQKAIDLEPDSPDALAVLALSNLRYDYDWEGAEQLFQDALRIEQTNITALHWYSHLLSWQGRHPAALAMAKRGLAADPLWMQTHLVLTLAQAGQWDEAFALGEETLRQDGNYSLMQMMWRYHIWAGRAAGAAATFKDWAVATGRSAAAAEELGAAFIQFQQTGVSVPLADDLLEQLQLRDVTLPLVYASVGDKEKTISALQDSHTRRTVSGTLLSLKINPAFDFIRDDPRFVELLAQIGLAD